MSFTILPLGPDVDPSWPRKIMQAVPGVVAKAFTNANDAAVDLEIAEAVSALCPPSCSRARGICAGSARRAPGLAARGSTTRWSRAMSLSPTRGAATRSTWRPTPSLFCLPLPVDSIITCRRSVGCAAPR
jgi:hypothetical protein